MSETQSTAFPRRLRAVLFDLDGTLIDTADEFIPAVQQLRSEHGLPPMAAADIRANVSNGAAALVTAALGTDQAAAEFQQQRERLLELYAQALGTAAKPYPGIIALLKTIAERNLSWGIATNKPREYTEPLLASLALDPPPGSVVCPDDVSERKPHPESLYCNCKALDCAPHEAIYIGDHERDIQAGRRAGMFTIAAGYGYVVADDDPQRWGADLCIMDSRDLEDAIFSASPTSKPS